MPVVRMLMTEKTLVDILADRFPQSSRSALKRMILSGRVSINGQPARKLTQPVGPTDRVEVASKPSTAPPPALGPLELVHEDNDILIIQKPAGLLTSTVPREKRPTALAIVRRYTAAAGLIHRLDRDASGILVFSKNDQAYESLKTQFFRHSVDRIYLAIVHGTPSPAKGTIESHLVEYADGTVHSTRARGKGQIAITHYEVVGNANKMSAVRIRLETWRKHQIRAHLAQRGWPIVGDRVYGRPDGAAQLMLAAVELALTHPRTGQRMTFKHDPSPEFSGLIPL